MAGYRTRRRANGEGTIYYVEAEGRWRGAVTFRDATGRSRRRGVSALTQAEARRRLAALRADTDRGLAPAGPLGDYLTGWLARERPRIRPSTWHQREQHVRLYLVPRLGRVPLAKLSPLDVERVTAALVAEGRSPSTAAKVRVTLRKALGDAVRDGLAARNAAALARPPRIPGRDLQPGREYLEPAPLRDLLDALADHPLGPLVTLAATTGLRQGELLGLAWPDIDNAAGTLRVHRSLARSWDGWALAEPKSPRSRRTIHLPARAIEALRRQRDAQEAARAAVGADWQDTESLVFTDAVGRPLRGPNVTHAFQDALAALGLPRVPFHALRHSAATALLSAGVPLRVVSDQLGHSTISLTADTYAAVVPELRRDAAEAMDRVLR